MKYRLILNQFFYILFKFVYTSFRKIHIFGSGDASVKNVNFGFSFAGYGEAIQKIDL